jgi:hypothetical protein
MPFKLRNNRRHKFEKICYKITNWREYNEALKKRGSITLWLSTEIIKAWYPNKRKTQSLPMADESEGRFDSNGRWV